MGSGEELRQDLARRVAMDRRRFLGLMAAGAGAAVLAGCSSSGSDGADDSAGSTTTSTATAPGGDVMPLDVPSGDGIESNPFLLGVASGDPLPSSVILWTKLTTDLVDTSGFGGLGESDFEVLWEVATDDTFTTLVATGIEPASATFGHAVHVDATGLRPDNWYSYRFRIGDHTSPVGTTRTSPADDDAIEKLTFVFASCQLRAGGYWTSYEHIVADAPDLVLFLGDYIYEYPGGDGELGNPLDAEPQTLADYRVLYANYKRDEGIQAAHAVAPWVITWDDHEVENNYAGAVPEKSEDQATFGDRRTAAYQAFYEHHPLRIDPPADDGSLGLYRTVRFGSLANFVVLDGRQYRTDQVCGDNIATNAKECPELDDADNTMLGAEQEQWVADTLASSDTTWTVLAQQTVMKALVLGDIVLNVDQWDGYPAARGRLFDAIDAADIENVVVLTGDIHAGGAADLRAPDAGTDGAIVAHEFVAPGISSPGLGAIAQGIDASILGLAYANFSDNGYVRCTVTPDDWTTEFVVVDTIADPTSPASVAAAVGIDAGTPGIQTR